MANKDWRKHKDLKENIVWTKREYPQIYINMYKSLKWNETKRKGEIIWKFENLTDRTFKTKSAALKFARSYMRKH